MTVHNTMGVVGKAADGTAVPLVTPTNVRNTLAGLFRRELTSAKVRTGRIKSAAGGNMFVAAGAGWTYTVEPGALVYATSATSGAYLIVNDTLVTLTTDPKPTTGSRVDLIYAVQKDAFDGSNDETRAVIDLAKGQAVSSGTPQDPAIPPGAIVIGRNVMTSAATSTSSTGNTLTNPSDYTTPAGGVGYYGSVTSMQADTSRYRGDLGYVTADDRVYVKWNAGTGTGAVEKPLAYLDDTQTVRFRSSTTGYTSGAIIRDSNERTVGSPVTFTVPAGKTATIRGFARMLIVGNSYNCAGRMRLKVDGVAMTGNEYGRWHTHSGKVPGSWFSMTELGYQVGSGTHTLTLTNAMDSGSSDTEVWDALAQWVVEY